MGGFEWVNSSSSGPSGRTETRIRYSVKSNPGSSFTITENSVIRVIIPFYGGAIACSKFFSATAKPVLISLAGPMEDTDHSLDILIGQGCTATLTVGGAYLPDGFC
jgi:hypothetical protein